MARSFAIIRHNYLIDLEMFFWKESSFRNRCWSKLRPKKD